MVNVSTIVKQLGRRDLGARLSVSPSAIQWAVKNNLFSASWYPTVKQLADEKCVYVPDHLFHWRVPQASKAATRSNDESG